MSDTACSQATLSITERRVRLRARVEPASSLTAATRHQMWNVFSQYYDAVEHSRFESDLREKQYVILLHDADDGSIQGFSTVQVLDAEHEGRPCLVLYSGDTVIDRRYWGQGALHVAFIRLAFTLKLRHPGTPVFYFLISKGYKTYLMLTRNVPEYWPRYDRSMPDSIRHLVNGLAQRKFGADWKPELGVIQFPECVGRLKTGVAPIDETLLQVPEVKFFVERNPGHAQGDELACLAKIDWRMIVNVIFRKLWKS